MKNKLLLILLVSLLAASLVAAPRNGKSGLSGQALEIDNDTWIDANRIFMFVTNHGNFARDLSGVFGHDYGTFYPFVNFDLLNRNVEGFANSVIYASGLWMGAEVGGQTRVIISEFDDEYVPGPMAGGTFQADLPEFRVYKLYKDSALSNPNQDYLDYMEFAVVNQGAPTREDTTFWVCNEGSFPSCADSSQILDTTGEVGWDMHVDTIPDMIGDQFLWSVYNDADPAQHLNGSGSTAPLGIEVKHATFAFNREDPLGEVIFVRYRVFNKGGNNLDNFYISLWCDADLGGFTDDFVGCDTNLSLGFVYNGTNNDGQFGSRPPAVGYDFFQGPLINTGNMDDVAKMWGQLWPGYINMPLVTFNKYINGTDPNDAGESFNYMQGLRANGTDYTYEGATLLFMHSGDPVAGTGDLDATPDDRRFMMSVGPLTWGPDDSTEILAGIVVGQGGDRLSSVSVLKFNDQFAQLAYDVDFIVPEPPRAPDVKVTERDGTLNLYWGDTSEVDHGDYPFEGYTVYQGESPAGPWMKLANYDVANGIGPILDHLPNPETGLVEEVGVKFGLDGGIQRHYDATIDAVLGEPLRNLTPYFFRVEAYTFDGGALPKTLTSATNIIVIPQKAGAGVEVPEDMLEIIDVNHVTGVSGGIVWPIVMDPFVLTGHTYQVWFEDTLGFVIDTIYDPVHPGDIAYATLDSTNTAWFYMDLTTGDTLLVWQGNNSLDEVYPIIDGIQLKVSGPAAGFNSFQVVANASGPLDPPESGAFPWADFPVPTGVDPDGYPTDGQQVGAGKWGFHTADNGGSCAAGGGTRGNYTAFLSRALRDGGNDVFVGIFDFEMRFTGEQADTTVGGGYAIEWYNDDNVFWVPFELWRIGIGTPDDASDDVRLVPFIIDDWGPGWEGNDMYGLESWGCGATGSGDWEHSVSGGDNDPFTDWVYWYMPSNNAPGEAGYLENESQMLAGTFAADSIANEILARTVLVNWNGGVEPPFNQDVPEKGTVFRLTTAKPNTSADTFTFVATQPMTTANEDVLKDIKAVPNPYYLFGPYDPSAQNRSIKFSNLPPECTIRIFNLAGDMIATVEHTTDDPDPTMVEWNVLTDMLLPPASGIYIYHVDAPGFGQKIGKMAIFTEVEVLDKF